MSKTVSHILSIPSDASGCSTYRLHFPFYVTRSLLKDKIVRTESMRYILDTEFYRGLKLIQTQKPISPGSCHFVTNFLKPLRDTMGFWLSMDVDDVLGGEDIPKYNIGRKMYQEPKIMENLKAMLNTMDIVTTTTEELKQYYVSKFEVDANRIVIIPNYLPRWWIGEMYDIERIKSRFNRQRIKRKIVFPLSVSHFDVEKQNDCIDDLTPYIDFIKNTIKKYEWHFMGGACPHQLIDLVKSGDIKMHAGSDILNYPRELHERGYDAIVAPLQDNIFNRCKSNIKLIEGWAMGIPVLAQNLVTYSKYTEWTFDDANGLQNKLDKLFSGQSKYLDVVKDNRNKVDYGDENSKNGWWMEKNISKWLKLFTLPQRCLSVDYSKYDPETMKGTVQL